VLFNPAVSFISFHLFVQEAMMIRNSLRVLSALVVLGLLVVPLTVSARGSAHEHIESGSYALTVGWSNEPVIVGQANGLDLFIATKDEHAEEEEHTEGDEHAEPEGVTGAEATLKLTVEYGSVSQTYDLEPAFGRPGGYTVSIIPTREGQYTFHFTGKINDENVDVSVEPEEVAADSKFAFPEALPSTRDLETKLTAAQAQTQTAQTLAIVGVVLGIIGTGLGAYGIMKKK
jgi:hypothetical protein